MLKILNKFFDFCGSVNKKKFQISIVLGGRCEAVEAGKGPGEAVRRVIAELQRDVDNLPVRREDLQPGGGEPALADIVAHRHAAQHSKALLKVKGGTGPPAARSPGWSAPPGDAPRYTGSPDECLLPNPLVTPSFWIQHTGNPRPRPDFPCFVLSARCAASCAVRLPGLRLR